MNLRLELEKRISAALVAAGATDAPALVAPTEPQFGDYKASGVMAAAKKLKLKPRELAEKVVAILRGELSDLADKIEIAGPGFINIRLKDEFLSTRLGELMPRESSDGESDEPRTLVSGQADRESSVQAPVSPLADARGSSDRLGVEPPATPQTIVVDYSAPNLAKEMHVGHLRSTIIGDALARVLEFQGNNVIRQNHVGDWGTQFGMLIQYLQEKIGGFSATGASVVGPSTALADLEDFYRRAKALFDENEEFAAHAREQVVRLQGGDYMSRLAWGWFLSESMDHCQSVYRRLGVTLGREHIRGESAYNDDLPNVIADLQKVGLLAESQGAMCVFLPQFVAKDGTPLPLIVQKSDEGYLYATSDLAAIRYRVGTLHADRVLYVVDARQSLHFQMVFATARVAGFAPENVSLEHVAFGTMMGADGKPFKTRTGGTVKLMDLLDEAVKRAYDLVTQKNADEVAKGRSAPLSEEQKMSIAEAVGIGAVKYADLAQNRNSDYVFSWDKMLAMDGNTAPYMQYAYARIKSIFRKSSSGTGVSSLRDGTPVPQVEETGETPVLLRVPAERRLAVKLLQFPETIAAVAADCLPSVLCAYLYDLAGAFTTFYENCPVLKSDESVRSSRLVLCDLTARTIKKTLELLGINVIEQM